MKAETTARIARTLIAIVVIVIFAVPTYSGINGYQTDTKDLVSIDSEYELKHMSESDLASNMYSAVKGKSDDVFTIHYINTSGVGETRIMDLKGLNDSDVQTAALNAAHDVLTYADKNKTALLLNGKGELMHQQIIMATADDLTAHIYTGMKVKKSITSTFVPTLSLNTWAGGEKVKISDINFEATDNRFEVEITVPFIVLGTAMASKQNFNIDVDIAYKDFMDVSFALDVPASTFFASSSYSPADLNATFSEGGKKLELNVSVSGLPPSLEAQIDDVKFTVDGSKITVQSMNDKTIVENLEKYKNEDGELVFKYDDSGTEKEIKIDAEMSDSFIKIIKSMPGATA